MHADLGKDSIVQENVIVGLEYKIGCKKATIGARALIRAGTIIYADVKIGDDFKTGHSVLIRENTKIGNNVLVGSNTVIDGNVEIGDLVKIESNVYIPSHTKIGSHVFVGPGAVLTNDKYPQRLRNEYETEGPIVKDSVTIGANATILPGVRIGEGSIVGAGSVVTRDIPEWSLATGIPARNKPLPEKLREKNKAKHR
ncbi:DapH/DapD/GlmU-related protein [Chloroflexota bacterium]